MEKYDVIGYSGNRLFWPQHVNFHLRSCDRIFEEARSLLVGQTWHHRMGFYVLDEYKKSEKDLCVYEYLNISSIIINYQNSLIDHIFPIFNKMLSAALCMYEYNWVSLLWAMEIIRIISPWYIDSPLVANISTGIHVCPVVVFIMKYLIENCPWYFRAIWCLCCNFVFFQFLSLLLFLWISFRYSV